MYTRTLTLGLCAVLLMGCGFRPLYGGGRDGEAATELASIRVAVIAERIGQKLHNHLLDLLNPRGSAAAPKYVLRVVLTGSTERLAIAKSELATRANYGLVARYQLLQADGKRSFLTGTKKVVRSYNILTSDFATLMVEKDAKARAIQEIGHDIRTQLALFFVQRRADRDKAAP